ncbi:MBL fold metallo-hydrolase [Actinokineospora bangkokensis]|uniref:MBL fold metallo-hydrolase n=1 Tax=Actinokineospora bangkokensis TaxID=1193682 RepID=A0A1Q9LC43_9PSEU|nr:MBL fold metallo-hydrolase [Actinokineospora bangkokensis]OLR89575.1 MBL fold metallo-hydrolase [Actinokineospora bangkokensis]
MRWIELADGVLACRHDDLDLTLGLVVGARRCLVVDTGTDAEHGARWAAAVRAVTPLPWDVVITHAHWDHHLGTSAFLPAPVWAHPAARHEVEHGTAAQVAEWSEREPRRADRLAAAPVVLPDREVRDRVELDLGGRSVELLHLGPGHTPGDVLVRAGDVLFAGDLVEQGAPPAVGPDADVASWVAVLGRIGSPRVVVPGHGEPVDTAFVAAQRAELARLVR